MNDSRSTPEHPQHSEMRRNFGLRTRMVRYRALRSAWAVLAPSGLSTEKQRIADTGRSLNDELTMLVAQHPDVDQHALEKLDPQLDSFEREMRSIAQLVPLAQLRSTLPERVADDRRGVLDLLDLLLGAEIEGLEGTEARIGVIDYVITLLCTTGANSDAAFLHDPVTLTPRLYGLCEQSDVDYDSRLPEIEAEFFAAADMHEAEVRSSGTLHALARRKMELGPNYFAPGVLRSIVAYNTALSRRITEAVESSQDWGSLPTEACDPRAGEPTPTGVFESPVIRELADALRRRAAGDAPQSTAIDRIAWCLDLAYPDSKERASLLGESVGLPDNLAGTTILVGLLSRSAVVLEDEFPAIGLSAQQLAAVWVPELDTALKRASQEQIAGDDYQRACVLAELKNKFLYAPMIEVHREQRGRAPATVTARRDADAARAARKIVKQALEAELEEASVGLAAWRTWPWGRLARIAAIAAATVAVGLGTAKVFFPAGDLATFSREELLRISPMLASGGRNRQGSGPAFVGTLEERWAELAADEKNEAASSLVERLHAQGVSQVMVYDETRQLRIQALGAERVKVLPAKSQAAQTPDPS